MVSSSPHFSQIRFRQNPMGDPKVEEEREGLGDEEMGDEKMGDEEDLTKELGEG